MHVPQGDHATPNANGARVAVGQATRACDRRPSRASAGVRRSPGGRPEGRVRQFSGWAQELGFPLAEV
jgi:hypothetical protein